jgi:hypothetical protein
MTHYEIIFLLPNNHTDAVTEIWEDIPLTRQSARYYRDLMNRTVNPKAQIRKVSL